MDFRNPARCESCECCESRGVVQSKFARFAGFAPHPAIRNGDAFARFAAFARTRPVPSSAAVGSPQRVQAGEPCRRGGRSAVPLPTRAGAFAGRGCRHRPRWLDRRRSVRRLRLSADMAGHPAYHHCLRMLQTPASRPGAPTCCGETFDMSARHPRANASQRARRAAKARIDYYPSPEALAVIESRRTRYGTTNNNSGIIDTIIAEWVALAGLCADKAEKPPTSATRPELRHQNAHARMSSGTLTRCASTHTGQASTLPEFSPASHARAGANNSGMDEASMVRVTCGARRRRDGQPCEALSVPGKRRCKWHGGESTGPKTEAGRMHAIRNLRQYSASPSATESNQMQKNSADLPST